MNTIENNKLIAEFMGLELEETLNNEWVYAIEIEKNTTDFFTIEELRYHSDWDWLMEVVEKIESLGFDFAIYTGSSTSIINTNDLPFEEIVSEGCKNKKEAVYKSCLQFIEWYNKQKEV